MKQENFNLDHNKFQILSARDFLRDVRAVREAGGIYAIFLRDGEHLLRATGYAGLTPPSIGDFLHLYSGSSYALGKRLKNHLAGKLERSTFRETLFAINTYCDEVIRRDIIRCQGRLDEQALSDWLDQNALVAFRYCDEPAIAESVLLKRLPSPLNISDRRPDPYARSLIAMRCAMKGRPIPRCCWGAAQESFVRNQRQNGDYHQ